MRVNLALTGANGFLGSHLNKRLKKYYNLYPISLKTYAEIKLFLEEIKKNKFKIIINCAASLSPKKEIDIFINAQLPLKIENSIHNKSIKLSLIL